MAVCGGTVEDGCPFTGSEEEVDPPLPTTNNVPYLLIGVVSVVVVGVVFVRYNKKHERDMADLKRKYEVAEIKSKV